MIYINERCDTAMIDIKRYGKIERLPKDKNAKDITE